MLNSSHRIRRLRCLVSTNSQTEAFAIRKSLHDRWQDSLLPVFERAFDEIARGDRTIHIPKLELRLKITSEQELMEVLPDLIEEQLRAQLQSINWQTIPTTQSEFIWQETTTEQDQFATLLQYLQIGSVPWQVAYTSASEIAVNLKEACHKERSQLLNYLSNQPETAPFYFRLLQLLPEAEFCVLINALSDKFSPEWRTAITEFINFVLNPQNNSLNQPTQWQLVAAILSECLRRSQQRISSDLSRIVAKIIAESGSEPDAFFRSLPDAAAILFQPQLSYDNPSASPPNLSAIENQEISMADSEVRRSPLPPALNSEQQRDDRLSLPLPNPPIVENQETSIAEREVRRSPLNPALNSEQQRDDRPSLPHSNPPTVENQETRVADGEATRSPLNPDAISLFENRHELSNRENELSNYALNLAGEIAATGDEFPLSVNYAGLVLLHPFISPFFEATGVKETNSKVIADSKIARAAALLHFLATGQEELYEYELGLIKILLGLEPETPLLVGKGLLQEGDRPEAERVLQSTINYWSILKSTSINGLRSSFLQRSGLLQRTENGWKLQVEHQSFDMLLEHLPWSISIIKLSWMKQPLYTEWQTF
jgi:hypothetical protein